MNEDTDQKVLFLSWQRQVTGPFTFREIQTLLKLGKIHSLYKIQVDDEWLLLRDRLAELDHDAREADRRQAERLGQATSSRSPSDSGHRETIPLAIPIPAHGDWGSTGAPIYTNSLESDGDTVAPESKGIAITSFVLSLLFFVPFLNGITWLLSLIFGHLALSQAGDGKPSKTTTLAWVGLWISYVEISFFLTVFLWFALTRFPYISAGYLVLHGLMLFNVLGALMGAGVLMLAIKLTTGCLLRFPVCFVSALLPSALGSLGFLLVQTSISPLELTRAKAFALIGILYAFLFVIQMVFWARFIRLPKNDEELGFARGALASLLYTLIFIFVGIGYVILFASLIPGGSF